MARFRERADRGLWGMRAAVRTISMPWLMRIRNSPSAAATQRSILIAGMSLGFVWLNPLRSR
jgi:hypothetical protein